MASPTTPEPETIAAIATAPGDASLGVVRLSGPRALEIADHVFRGSSPQPLAATLGYTARYGWVVNLQTGQAIDEVLALVMRAPRSYTREDVVEFSGHGGLVGVRRILGVLLAAGARLAEPGEFTRRAFLNGRIDLAQAEAVLQLIRATHEAAHTATLQQLRGGLSAEIRTLRDRLIAVQAHLEVMVDFPGEDHETWAGGLIGEKLEAARAAASRLLEGAQRATCMTQGLLTVICGRPNVGKSSLLNAILRRERVIVSSIPGTTRDTIEEFVMLHGLPVRLVDTAGISASSEVLEAAGTQRSREAVTAADAAVWVVDGSEPLTPLDAEVAHLIRGRQALVALNKMDLPRRVSEEDIAGLLPDVPIVPVAARTGEGIHALERTLTSLALDAQPAELHAALVVNVRHREALQRALGAIQQASEAMAARASPELVVVDVREALDQLGLVTGETVSDELLDAIFSQFCIGK